MLAVSVAAHLNVVSRNVAMSQHRGLLNVACSHLNGGINDHGNDAASLSAA